MSQPLASDAPPAGRPAWWITPVEIAMVFAVFFVEGAWPVPDVNEPYYLGKAIHFWDSDWARGDAFLDSADTQQTFYVTFGWLSLCLSAWWLAWVGRLLTWGLLAWAWHRLSAALIGRPWYSVLTAALFVCLLERFHMAGEWVIGGLEAKGFAYVLVFVALEAMLRNRWNTAWLLLGAASAFHVLVGGWSAVAAGVAWLFLRRGGGFQIKEAGEPKRARERGHRDKGPESAGGLSVPTPDPQPATPRSLWSMGPALLGGFLLALPGLIPALRLTWGADAQTVNRASEIYVFGRLAHHLVPSHFPATFVDRFLLLTVLWLVLEWITPATPRSRRLRMFVVGALAIAGTGAAIGLVEHVSRALCARLLRFYWFRLSDVAVPLAVSLAGVRCVAGRVTGTSWLGVETEDWRVESGARRNIGSRPSPLATHPSPLTKEPGPPETLSRTPAERQRGKWAMAVVILAAALHVGARAASRLRPTVPRADRLHDYDSLQLQIRDYLQWRDACEWVANSAEIPQTARFLTPRMSQTFKWYTGRSEVATWKEIPQDAASIVRWWETLCVVYMTGTPEQGYGWRRSLADLGAWRLWRLARAYDAQYVLTDRWPRLGLPVVYQNDLYVIYRVGG